MKQSRGIQLLAFFFLGIAEQSFADQFHHSNLLIGDRAIGLGGAYGGVADDASGIFYNPAGLSFALSNDVSGSANALYQRKTVYKKAIGNKDFTEKSEGTVPSFFGGLQKLDNFAKGLVFAFAMYTSDGDLKDQNDLIEGVDLGQELDPIDSNTRCNEYEDGTRTTREGGELPMRRLQRFHRTVNQRSSTFHAGAALGWRLTNSFALGFGLNYVKVDELVQEYQDVRIKGASCLVSGSYIDNVQQLGQNIRQNLTAYGLQPVIAMQTSFYGRLSLGVTAKFGTYVSQRFEQGIELRRTTLYESDQTKVDEAGDTGASARIGNGSADIFQFHRKNKLKKPLGSMPLQLRLGLAYFASTRLLTTFDITQVSAITNAQKINSEPSLYSTKAVTNLAAGMEYYLAPAVPIRLGLFTNNDSRPNVIKGQSDQRDHIDYTGGTIFLAWVQPNSQIGAGVVIQRGTGRAQKVSGSKVQDVEAQSSTFAFSASHSF